MTVGRVVGAWIVLALMLFGAVVAWLAVFPDTLVSVSMAAYFGVLGVVTVLFGGRARHAVERGTLVKNTALGGRLAQLGCLVLGAYFVGMALLWVWLFSTGV